MTSIRDAQARLTAQTDQGEARIRDLERLLELLRPLAGTRGPVWWALRRLPAAQRAEVAELRRRLRSR
jgi:hypothetical protein